MATESAPGDAAPVLVARDLVKNFVTKRGLLGRPSETVQAVAGVSFDVNAGKTLGIVGETGSGKSTLARLVTHLIEPDGGHVVLDGKRLDELRGRELLEQRSKIQMVFQDPRASLDPQRTIEHAIVEPLKVHRRGFAAERSRRVRDLIASVGLSERHLGVYPAQLSGGQRQRVAIARALAIEPKVIVADEPTSALDLSTRSEILNLLMEVQDRTKVALVLISHDLSVVRHLADQTAVMYLGKLVELGDGGDVAGNPQHPYTMALMSAAPVLSTSARPSRLTLQGDAPNPADPPRGCRFHPRCPFAVDRCRTEEPVLELKESGVMVACHLAGRIESPAIAAAGVSAGG